MLHIHLLLSFLPPHRGQGHRACIPRLRGSYLLHSSNTGKTAAIHSKAAAPLTQEDHELT